MMTAVMVMVPVVTITMTAVTVATTVITVTMTTVTVMMTAVIVTMIAVTVTCSKGLRARYRRAAYPTRPNRSATRRALTTCAEQ